MAISSFNSVTAVTAVSTDAGPQSQNARLTTAQIIQAAEYGDKMTYLKLTWSITRQLSNISQRLELMEENRQALKKQSTALLLLAQEIKFAPPKDLTDIQLQTLTQQCLEWINALEKFKTRLDILDSQLTEEQDITQDLQNRLRHTMLQFIQKIESINTQKIMLIKNYLQEKKIFTADSVPDILLKELDTVINSPALQEAYLKSASSTESKSLTQKFKDLFK